MREFKEGYKVIEVMVVIMVMVAMVVMNFSFLIVFFPIKINFQLFASATINQ